MWLWWSCVLALNPALSHRTQHHRSPFHPHKHLCTAPTTGPTVVAGKDSRAFGSQAGKTLSAQYGIEQVPGLYEGRPDRYFDDRQDPRKHAAHKDSYITRNALGPDLLDLDFGAQEAEAQAQAQPELPQMDLHKTLADQKMQVTRAWCEAMCTVLCCAAA